MRGKPPSPRGCCSIPVKSTAWARSTTARPPWTTCPRNKSGASPSPRPARPANGTERPSTSSIRPATLTLPSKWNARSAYSTARSASSAPWAAWSRNRKRSGGSRNTSACRSSPSSIRWTGSARTSPSCSIPCRPGSARTRCPSSFPWARRRRFRGSLIS